jgi:hypothetical protein
VLVVVFVNGDGWWWRVWPAVVVGQWLPCVDMLAVDGNRWLVVVVCGGSWLGSQCDCQRLGGSVGYGSKLLAGLVHSGACPYVVVGVWCAAV